MKGKELAEIAKQYEDFEFEFVFVEEPKEGDRFLNVRVFKNLVVKRYRDWETDRKSVV